MGIYKMIYRTKKRTVKALPIGFILQTAEGNFKSLPTWVKKAYQDQKLFFGFSRLMVMEKDWRKVAMSGEMLVLTNDNDLRVISEKVFYELYEDEFGSTCQN